MRTVLTNFSKFLGFAIDKLTGYKNKIDNEIEELCWEEFNRDYIEHYEELNR